eukprot:CAMPEP_0195114706 /NCGR_PEP_ID=MMETSP0448-20130528/106725_1 /TAXON_ID=66468 /ORGANISM="Heterocapsa triquestra, Strain CCMP 448" /LENGTH=150 /DNA_ID=CAMNT_0040151757 /DNA_START=128 /DNA_END=576 /DNA_ORIENTATION=-
MHSSKLASAAGTTFASMPSEASFLPQSLSAVYPDSSAIRMHDATKSPSLRTAACTADQNWGPAASLSMSTAQRLPDRPAMSTPPASSAAVAVLGALSGAAALSAAEVPKETLVESSGALRASRRSVVLVNQAVAASTASAAAADAFLHRR